MLKPLSVMGTLMAGLLLTAGGGCQATPSARPIADSDAGAVTALATTAVSEPVVEATAAATAGISPTAQPTVTRTASPVIVATATVRLTATSPSDPIAAEAARNPAASGPKATFVMVPEESSVTYSIGEVLLQEDDRLATVVGKTNRIQGQFKLNYNDPSASQFGFFVVNMGSLNSGQPERDQTLREEWLEWVRYPLASFAAKEVRNFPADAEPGQPIEFQLVGAMTIKETTREVTWDVIARLDGERLRGTATTFVALADFDMSPPGLPGVLEVVDGVTVTVDFTFRKPEPTPVLRSA
jgi:polyisoprenoid-binding protein YceI